MWIEIVDVTGVRRIVNTDKVTEFRETSSAGACLMVLDGQKPVLINARYGDIFREVKKWVPDDTGEKLRKREEFFRGK